MPRTTTTVRIRIRMKMRWREGLRITRAVLSIARHQAAELVRAGATVGGRALDVSLLLFDAAAARGIALADVAPLRQHAVH
jgi:hypothetical protein